MFELIQVLYTLFGSKINPTPGQQCNFIAFTLAKNSRFISISNAGHSQKLLTYNDNLSCDSSILYYTKQKLVPDPSVSTAFPCPHIHFVTAYSQLLALWQLDISIYWDINILIVLSLENKLPVMLKQLTETKALDSNVHSAFNNVWCAIAPFSFCAKVIWENALERNQ